MFALDKSGMFSRHDQNDSIGNDIQDRYYSRCRPSLICPNCWLEHIVNENTCDTLNTEIIKIGKHYRMIKKTKSTEKSQKMSHDQHTLTFYIAVGLVAD